jgi:hypothetical protein
LKGKVVLLLLWFSVRLRGTEQIVFQGYDCAHSLAPASNIAPDGAKQKPAKAEVPETMQKGRSLRSGLCQLR